MFIKEITISGFGSFYEVPTTYTFNQPLTTIIGSNGSGKTSILHAIMWALLGKDAVRVAGDMASVVNKKTLRATIILSLIDNNSQPATIMRSYAETEGGTSAHTLVFQQGRSTKKSITTAQNAIYDMLGVDKNAFQALSVIDQHTTGKISSIITAKPEERRNIIASFLSHGDDWAAIQKAAVATRRETKRAIKELDSDIAFIVDELREYHSIIHDAENVTYTEEDLSEAKKKAQLLEREQNDYLAELKKKRAALKEKIDHHNQQTQDTLSDLSLRINKLRSRQTSYKHYLNQVDKWHNVVLKQEEILGAIPDTISVNQVQYLHSDIERLQHHADGLCPLCDADLPEGDRMSLIKASATVIKQLEALGFTGDIMMVKAEKELAENHLQELQENPIDPVDEEELERLQQKADQLTASLTESEELAEYDAISQQLADNPYSEKLSKAWRVVDNISEGIALNRDAEIHRKKYESLLLSRDDALAKQEVLQRKLQALELLVQASTPNGVISSMIEKEAERLCDNANNALGLMDSPHLSIYPEIRYAKRAGKELPEMYFVHGAGSLKRDVQTFSSGEKARIAFAMSLGSVLAFGANTPKILLLDEPMSMVDEDHVDSFHVLLSDCLNKGILDQVIMTSRLHNAVNPMHIASTWQGVS